MASAQAPCLKPVVLHMCSTLLCCAEPGQGPRGQEVVCAGRAGALPHCHGWCCWHPHPSGEQSNIMRPGSSRYQLVSLDGHIHRPGVQGSYDHTAHWLCWGVQHDTARRWLFRICNSQVHGSSVVPSCPCGCTQVTGRACQRSCKLRPQRCRHSQHS